MDLLEDKLARLPGDPGVYLMKDKRGVIIYVGKAKNLKNRVSSYFTKGEISLKTKAMVSDIHDFELILTRTEVEALLLERTLIKHHTPRYNVLLRDDKQFPFLKINYSEKWPRIEKVRKRKNDGASYIGPFSHSGNLDTILKTVKRIFPIVRCSKHEFRNAKRPCNYYHMKMCLAPCVLEVDPEEYKSGVKNAEALLRGSNTQLKKQLFQLMKQAAEDEDFERAAGYRDQLNALESITQSQVAIINSKYDSDVIGIFEKDSLAINITIIRNRSIVGRDNFHFQNTIENLETTLTTFLMQYYEDRDLPEQLILPIDIQNRKSLLEALGQDNPKKTRIKTGSRGEEKSLIDLATKNAAHYFQELRHQKETNRIELELLQSDLQLSTFPKRIECLDISNLQNTAIVAGLVCFIDGKPSKNLYRKYNLKTVVETHDDYSSIEEIVERRLRRGIEEMELPDLLVIDGGQGQLTAALKAKALFPGIDISIISLAKSRNLKSPETYSSRVVKSSERVFMPDQTTPIPLRPGSPTFRVLTRVRDEAHRFAIGFHRKQRSKGFTTSQLDNIQGVGPVLKQRLLTRFASVEEIKQQSIETLCDTKGVNEDLAARILAELNDDND